MIVWILAASNKHSSLAEIDHFCLCFPVLIHTLFGAAPCITGAAMDDQAVAFGMGRDELNSRVHRPDGSALHCKIFEFLQRHCATALNQNNFNKQIDPVSAQTSEDSCNDRNPQPATRNPLIPILMASAPENFFSEAGE